MLSLEQLTQYIEALRATWFKSGQAQKAGIDLTNFGEILMKPASVLERVLLNKHQRDELAWWLYDIGGINGEPKKSRLTKITYTETGKIRNVHTIKLLHQYLLTLEEKPPSDKRKKPRKRTQEQPE